MHVLEGIWHISEPLFQYCFELNTALKNKVFKIKRTIIVQN